MTDDDNTVVALLKRYLGAGAGVAIVALFWFGVVLLSVVATAQSQKPWDTVIAAAAATSQGVFAYLVWRLNKQQYAFQQRVTDRQHKIDSYPLREKAVEKLIEAFDWIRPGLKFVHNQALKEFQDLVVEISRLFSMESFEKAQLLHATISKAYGETYTVRVQLPDSVLQKSYNQTEFTDQGHDTISRARDLHKQLAHMLEIEMRIG